MRSTSLRDTATRTNARESADSCVTNFPLVYAWGNNERRAELKGRRCRIVARGSRMRSVLLEFDNGWRVITSERAVRSAA